jgi:hypothetical protein
MNKHISSCKSQVVIELYFQMLTAVLWYNQWISSSEAWFKGLPYTLLLGVCALGALVLWCFGAGQT